MPPALEFHPGQIIRTPSGTVYEVLPDGSYLRRRDIEMQQQQVHAKPIVAKQKVKSYG